MVSEFQISGNNPAAPFTLKLHCGEGMVLVAMNWKQGQPPMDFVRFAIEYKEPGWTKYYSVQNRLAFPISGNVNPNTAGRNPDARKIRDRKLFA